MRPLAGVPLKDLDGAKGRLSPDMSPPDRRRLVEGTAQRVIEAAAGGFEVVVVSGSDTVARWAQASSLRHLAESPGRGLDGAAEAVVAAARAGGVPWCVIHADLPLIEAADLVTEMGATKHHFKAGVKAQQGIEF